MRTRKRLLKHERSITKAVFVVSLLTLIVLGSTVLVATIIRNTHPNYASEARGWQRTPEIRIVFDSTADWARIMFNDLYETNENGVRIVEFRSRGWLLGNDTDDRIDAGRGLTFVDIIYNATVVKTGDIVGFFKGNNDFHHTRMFVDVILEVNTNMRQVYVVMMLAGAGTTTVQFTSKQSGVTIWQDSQTGNSYTQYARRWIYSEAFFAKQQIETILVFVLIGATLVVIVVLNPVLRVRRQQTQAYEDSDGL